MCYNVAAVAVKLLIEQITRYCTVMLRSLQGEPCSTLHLNAVIVTRIIDRNTFRRPQHTPHPTPTTRLQRIDRSDSRSVSLNNSAHRVVRNISTAEESSY